MSIVTNKYCCTKAQAQTKLKALVQEFVKELEKMRAKEIEVNQMTALNAALSTVSKGKIKTVEDVINKFEGCWNTANTSLTGKTTESKIRLFFRYYCLFDPSDIVNTDGIAPSYQTYDTWIAAIDKTKKEPVNNGTETDLSAAKFTVTCGSYKITFHPQGNDKGADKKTWENANQAHTWKVLKDHAQTMINMIINQTGLTPYNNLNVYVRIGASDHHTTLTRPWTLASRAFYPEVGLKLFTNTNPAHSSNVNSYKGENTSIYKTSKSFLSVLQHELVHVLHFSHLDNPRAKKYGWINEGLAESIRGKKIAATKDNDKVLKDLINGPNTLRNTCFGTADVDKDGVIDENSSPSSACRYTGGFLFWKFVSALLVWVK